MSAWRSRTVGTIMSAVGATTAAGILAATPAAAAVTGQGDARNFGNSILVTLQNIRSTTDELSRCALLVHTTGDIPVIAQLMEIYDGGVGVWWTTMPNEELHLAGQYTDSADHRVTVDCQDTDGDVRLVDTVVTLPEGTLVGNPSRYSTLFGAF